MNEKNGKAKELLNKINEDLRNKFYGNDFGGELLDAYIGDARHKNGKPGYTLSMVFRATKGGKHSFIVKGKIDFVENVFKLITQEEEFVEVIVQVLKEDEPFATN